MDRALSFVLIFICILCSTGNVLSKPKTDTTQMKDSTILLCDSSKTKGGIHLVYAYIDGKRTECMGENTLRMLLSQQAWEKDTAYRREQSDKVMGNDIIAQIQKGRKDFKGLDLTNRDLMKLNLSGADLRGVNLSGTDLRRSNLTKADLRGAKLEGTFLMGSILQGAKLDSASLKGAYCMKTDLSGSSGVTLEMLKGVVSLYVAKMDSTLLAKAKKEFPGKFLAKKE
jgi:hypothetical protein